MSKVVSIEVGRAARASMNARRDELVAEHMYLVPPIAARYLRVLPPSFERSDLIAAGNMGLLRAASNYQPKEHRDTPFTAYARPVIRGEIGMSVRRRHYKNATLQPIEAAPEPVEESGVCVSLDQQRLKLMVRSAMNDLPSRHRVVVLLHYMEDLGLEQVGERLGVCASRASQLHTEALTMLRNSARLKRDARELNLLPMAA